MIIFVIMLLTFLISYKIERRNLWIGVAFIGLLFGLLFLLLSLYSFENHPILYMILAILAFLVFLLTFSGPLLFIVVCLYNGSKLLRREGIKMTNFLSLGLGLGILIYLFILPVIITSFRSSAFIHILYVYLGGIVSYLFLQVALYTLASFLNVINIGKRHLDYIVVLGAGLVGEEVTPLLASRLDKGIALLRKHSDSQLIVSGGQGPDEAISEAQAMANYAIRQGVSKQNIILENRSKNTYENISFSQELMAKNSQFALVTNYYHVFRALLLAKSQGFKCIGYGAKSKFYFSLNAFIREFIGYMVMTKKRHIILISLYTLLYISLIIIENIGQH
ncbi:YdcF family protein [Streptococcus sciuri]|uniref:YdcF family protein n=1 Tax=Streptococcus sciuri TaxID=2973939 RepID=A0ABT2F6C1_9STRE|nr:YdcF family protein [Streptococcus sciuri]MCS4487571.1 YdcF family protein [Streptococcus sciuri]